MADQEVVQASTYVWMRNRELSPLYERLVIVGGSLECLALIQELIDLHKKQVDDCHELLACIGVEIPGQFNEIPISDDIHDLLPIIWTRESEAMELGWVKADRFITDEAGRAVIIRGTGRQDRKLRIIREIAIKCNIRLIIEVKPTPPPWPVPPMPPVPGVQDYVVQPGDTMFLIAQRYGIPLDVLIRANPQIRNPELIYPGEVIHIPTARPMQPPSAVVPPVTPGTGGSGAARRYVVISGETIEIIARKFGMNVTELTAFNPQLSPPYMLSPGQVIFIPSPNAAG